VRILVTGGAGFIGANLCARALADGHDVVVIDDFSTGERDNVAPLDIRLVEGSVLDHAALSTAMTGVDAVVHLAALGSVPRSIKDPMATHEANATGTLRVLEAARAADVGHVSVASSSSVYGLNPALPKGEREWVRPMSPYAVSKLATEQYALAYQQSYDMDTLAFRFFNVYGPLQRAGHVYAAVIPVFMDALLSGRPLPMNGDGSHSRDFTFVGTVCEVLLQSATRGVTHPEPVNLAFGTNTTLLELVAQMEVVTGLPGRIAYQSPRPGDVLHSQADNAVLRSLFPDIAATGLEEGLSRTHAWFAAVSGHDG
jgi:UDP-glucose 4-epimerase